MANEIGVAYGTSGKTLYAVIRNRTQQPYNTVTPAFETHVDANWATYAVTLAEQGTSGNYIGSVPAGITTNDLYSYEARVRAGATPTLTDTSLGAQAFSWLGAAEAALSVAQARVTTALPSVAPGTVGGLQAPIVAAGTAQAGTSTSLTLAVGSSATTDLYKGNVIQITGGTGAGQARTISGYNGATLVATTSRAWTVTPDATSTYTVVATPHPALDANLAVTAGTVSDKTGYTASTVSDKTGYALSTAEHTAISGTDVPAALTTQGYTATRAGYLDTLNGLVAAIWGAATRTLSAFGFSVTAATVSDKTGYSLSVGDATATTVAANLNATVSSRLAASAYTAPDTGAAIAADILSAVAASYNTAGTIGAKINAAGTAADPWAAALPGSYGAGSAGSLVGALTASGIQADVTAALNAAPGTLTPESVAEAVVLARAALAGNMTISADGKTVIFLRHNGTTAFTRTFPTSVIATPTLPETVTSSA